MAADRFAPTATLLPNGKVLVAGGGSGGNGEAGALASAELYDPATNSWSSAGSMAAGREHHTATLLPSGKVLIAGGYSPGAGGAVASAELYDPATNSWSSVGSMAGARFASTATLLPGGNVLVAGGQLAGSPLASAELYDPATNSWTSAGSMAAGREEHTATLLPSGTVLIAGGDDAATPVVLASAELYVPDLAPPVSRPPKCAMSATLNVMILHAKRNKKGKASPATGMQAVKLTCDQEAHVELRATLTDKTTTRANGHGKVIRKRYKLARITATVRAQVIVVLKLKLPASVVHDLLRGARQHVIVAVTAANANGTSRTTARIGPLKRNH
jgi:hypothetical protein